LGLDGEKVFSPAKNDRLTEFFRAGLCADPKDYRYCGYAEALAKGFLLVPARVSELFWATQMPSAGKKSASSIASTSLCTEA